MRPSRRSSLLLSLAFSISVPSYQSYAALAQTGATPPAAVTPAPVSPAAAPATPDASAAAAAAVPAPAVPTAATTGATPQGVPAAAQSAAAPAAPAAAQPVSSTPSAPEAQPSSAQAAPAGQPPANVSPPTASPAQSSPSAADSKPEPETASSSKPSGEKEEKKAQDNKKGSKKRYKGDEEGQGYYYSTFKKPSKTEADEAYQHELDRHADQGGGYYGLIPDFKAPPPEPKPLPPPVVIPPPVAAPLPHDENDRKFKDDPGKFGSITFTRHATQANELLSSGHYDLAKKHFKEALRIQPDAVELLPGYWETCAKTSDWSESQRTLEHLFQLDPSKEKDYCWAQGQALFELRRWDKAVPTLKKAISFGKNVDECHDFLLKIAANQKNTADMITEYNAITKLRPGDAKRQLEFANLLETQGRHGEALAHYKAAAVAQPDGALLARIAYMLMSYNKDWNGALTFYNRALQVDPANANTYNQNIAYCKQQMELAAKAKGKK